MHTPVILPSGRSPRRELQGPRPTPLKVHKNSHKIRKPPMLSQLADQPHQRPPLAPPPRPPVIIYTVSPKIIHTSPDEFMSLVQRLTGPNSCNSPSSSTCRSSPLASPAARLASIEKTRSPKPQIFRRDTETMEGMEIGTDVLTTGHQFPGILSPDPNALQPISSKFFSTPSDNTFLNFLFNLSPVLHSNRNNPSENNNFILPSPSSSSGLMISPQINMPSPNTLDLFHSLFDL